MKPQLNKKAKKIATSGEKSVLRQIPPAGWLLIVFLYSFPAVLSFFYLDESLLPRLWMFTVFLVPGLLLSFYLGFTGALLANMVIVPILFLQTRSAFSERSEYALVQVSHLVTLMLCLLMVGVMVELLKRQEKRVQHLSVTDELSGLYNYRFFYSCLDKEIERARRFRQPLTLVIVDLDNFKKYNDTWGHLQGDRALATVAAVLKNTVRNIDIVARYGGEEFAIILPQTDLVSAKCLCERIREALSVTSIPADTPQGTTDPLTASFGVANYDGKMTAEQLVHEADKILYYAKSCGKNLVTCR